MQLGVLCLSLALVGLTSALICPDGGMCEDRNTCCKDPSGGYGCCPLPNAECCEDHLHCCYEGTVCDLVHSKCLNKTVSLPWLKRVPAKQPASLQLPEEGVKAVLCPDEESECPDGTTCCESVDRTWACCPLVRAVCCEDRRSCCPEGTRCDMTLSKCVSSWASFPLLEKLPARRREAPQGQSDASLTSVTCPGGKSRCPDGTTCCLLTTGEYGCCGYPEAVCCSDHLHCCPGNTSCDLEQGKCTSSDTQLPLARKSPASQLPLASKSPATPEDVNAVPCNDSVACADGSTCCKTLQGEWACCLLPKVPAIRWAAVTPDSKCDSSFSCPGKSTCCKTASGGWACCPLTQAVCCDDHAHCCPHGTVCNTEASTCDDPAGSAPPLPWAAKTPALSLAPPDTEKCDKQTMCPGGTTCCRQSSGQWACCPLPHAVCCDDHEHCCPTGYTCDVSQETCGKPGALSLPWVPKIPALPRASARRAPAVPRPAKNMCDGQTSCPKDTTCCFMNAAAQWGCCPLPKAVCCSDGRHCCPSGYTCDAQRASCSKGRRSIPWFRKEKALTRADPLADIKCDNKTSCSSGATCCQLSSGEWSCCPMVKAVCCSDHEHCCPQGYSCNMQSGTCEKKSGGLLLHTLPLSRVVESWQSAEADRAEDAPCDSAGEFRCAEQDTCCKTSASEWACCPSPKAVCCADGKHCCPLGYRCELAAGGCSAQDQHLTWDSFFTHTKRDFIPFGL